MLNLLRILMLGMLAWAAGGAIAAAAEEYTCEEISTPPEGLSAAVAARVVPEGLRINGPRRPLCDLWQVAPLTVLADFHPTAAVKYPFTPGQLVGVMQVPRRSGLTDFRGNVIEAGTYTLRYGRQPMDGNHIGTSDLADFLVAIPAAQDEDPATITDVQRLHELSAAASGTTHPAIFSLQPVSTPSEEPTVTHDAEHDFWILQVNVQTERGPLPVRVIVVGKSEG
jgi:hypothetical protein